MSKLVLFLADGTTLDVPLKRERMTIGRRADNDICLPNLAVSGEHAAVVTILADSFLEDLGSTNGTLVNASPIAKHFLRDGDQIDIGRHILVYCVDDDAVLSADFARVASRTALGNLGDRVETAKPFVKDVKEVKPGSGSAMRRDRAAENAAASRAAGIPTGPPRAAAIPDPGTVEPAAAPAPATRGIASVKVHSGSGEGQLVPLAKVQTSLGRAGVQVALITRRGESYRLKQIEGESPVQVNGSPLSGEVELAPGDIIDVVGTRVEFVGMPHAVTSN